MRKTSLFAEQLTKLFIQLIEQSNENIIMIQKKIEILKIKIITYQKNQNIVKNAITNNDSFIRHKLMDALHDDKETNWVNIPI